MTEESHTLARSTPWVELADELVFDALLATEILPCSLDISTRFATASRSLILGSGLEGLLTFFAADFLATDFFAPDFLVAIFFAAGFFAAVFFATFFLVAVFFAGVRFVGIVIT